MQVGRHQGLGEKPTWHITLSDEEVAEIIATPLIAERVNADEPKPVLIELIEILDDTKKYREEVPIEPD